MDDLILALNGHSAGVCSIEMLRDEFIASGGDEMTT
jgi:hypothetical protein